MLRYISQALRGTPEALLQHSNVMASERGIEAGLQTLANLEQGDPPHDDDAPIFLLSAGWRAGSTLVQRLVMTSGVMMWGEPYNACGLIQGMAATTTAFRRDWPLPQYYQPSDASALDLSADWIANLYPSVADFHRAHRAAFDTLFAQPARRSGAARWGIKEVRLGAEHAFYLRWLYPKAKFLLLYRNPLRAYQSYANAGRAWYDTWPDRPVFTPSMFGAHWRRLTQGYLHHAQALEALLVRYEDLQVDDTLIEQIETYLGLPIDRSLLARKVSGAWVEQAHVNRLERWLLKRAVGPLAQELGYVW